MGLNLENFYQEDTDSYDYEGYVDACERYEEEQRDVQWDRESEEREMKREEFLLKMSELYTKAEALVAGDDYEKVIGRLMLLARQAEGENIEAAMELMVLGIIMKEKEDAKPK